MAPDSFRLETQFGAICDSYRAGLYTRTVPETQRMKCKGHRQDKDQILQLLATCSYTGRYVEHHWR
jgi:hypothetical protein